MYYSCYREHTATYVYLRIRLKSHRVNPHHINVGPKKTINKTWRLANEKWSRISPSFGRFGWLFMDSTPRRYPAWLKISKFTFSTIWRYRYSEEKLTWLNGKYTFFCGGWDFFRYIHGLIHGWYFQLVIPEFFGVFPGSTRGWLRFEIHRFHDGKLQVLKPAP